MRVIAGTYRSRILKSLKGLALRPTSDRLRETLFNVLGGALTASRFIDLFAGTGAVGIEALSRGASEVVFIENHAPAATLIRRNLESLDIRSGATVLSMDAVRGLEKLAAKLTPGKPGYDFVFVDPPYAEAEEYARVLALSRRVTVGADGRDRNRGAPLEFRLAGIGPVEAHPHAEARRRSAQLFCDAGPARPENSRIAYRAGLWGRFRHACLRARGRADTLVVAAIIPFDPRDTAV